MGPWQVPYFATVAVLESQLAELREGVAAAQARRDIRRDIRRDMRRDIRRDMRRDIRQDMRRL